MRLGRRIWKLDRWLIDELGQEVRRQRVLLDAHRAEFLAEYEHQLTAPDGYPGGGAKVCLAAFERHALLADESRRDAATT